MTDETDGNVIDMKTRRPYWSVEKERKRANRSSKRRIKREQMEAREEHRDAMLSCLSGLTRLVQEDKLEGLLIIAREPTSKLFLTDVVMDDRIIPSNDLHAFIGCMETLKIELADAAAMAPALMLDGSVIDPEEHIAFEEDEY